MATLRSLSALAGGVAALCFAASVAAAPACDAGPVPVRLATDSLHPSAILLRPAFWEPGDPAAVVPGGEAFRDGCADRLVAALLGDGVLVLALWSEADEAAAERLRAAATVLRTGYGAGAIRVLSPAGGAATRAVLPVEDLPGGPAPLRALPGAAYAAPTDLHGAGR